MPTSLPPGLAGLVQSTDDNQRLASGRLAQFQSFVHSQGELARQQQEQTVRNILTQSPSPDAAIPILMRAGPLGIATAQRLVDVQKQNMAIPQMQQRNAATGALATLLSPAGGYQGNAENPQVSPPTATMLNEDAARQAAIEADKRGEQVAINVPNKSNVQALSVLADPQKAIPEILRQQRPSTGGAFTLGPNQTRYVNGQPVAAGPNVGAAAPSKYTHITEDGKGGFVGLNAATGKMEKIPSAEGVEAPTATMTPEALKVAGWEKLLFGTDPKGMGKLNSQQRSLVTNERERIGRELGLSPMEMAMMPQDNKVKMKAVDKLTTWGSFVDKAADQILPSIDLAIDYVKKLDPTTLQTLNKAILAGRKEFNDPNANAYAVAVNTVRREYGRLMSGPTSNAMLPVEAMKHADELISNALDVGAWNEVKNVVIKDAGFTRDAVHKQIDTLRNSITGGNLPAPMPAQPTTPSTSSGTQEGTRQKSKSGKPMIFRNGRWEYE